MQPDTLIEAAINELPSGWRDSVKEGCIPRELLQSFGRRILNEGTLIERERWEKVRRAATSLLNSGAHDQCGAEDMVVCADAFKELSLALQEGRP